jgi:UDP-N-acetylglucosamine 2-epimerase
MSEQNYRVEVAHHCAGCTCGPRQPHQPRPAPEEIVRTLTEAPARNETQHHPT